MTEKQERNLRIILVILILGLVALTIFSGKNKNILLNKPATTTAPLPTVEEVRNQDSIELNRKIDSVMREIKEK